MDRDRRNERTLIIMIHQNTIKTAVTECFAQGLKIMKG